MTPSHCCLWTVAITVVIVSHSLWSVSASACELTTGQVFSGQYQDQFMNNLIAGLKIDMKGSLKMLNGMQSYNIGPKLGDSDPKNPTNRVGPIIGPLYVNTVDPPACSPDTWSETVKNQMKGAIVLLMRGPCPKSPTATHDYSYFSNKIFAAQQAGAIAVIVSNNDVNTDYFLIRMMAIPTDPVTITIPSMFISAKDGNALRDLMKSVKPAEVVDAVFMSTDENSFRVTIKSVTVGVSTIVAATMEVRMTSSKSYHGNGYFKYDVTGKFYPATKNFSLKPQSQNGGFIWWGDPRVGIEGTVVCDLTSSSNLPFTQIKGASMPPYKVHFSARTNPYACHPALQYVSSCGKLSDKSTVSDISSYCGMDCLVATDIDGYRVFNDQSCDLSTNTGLVWYCQSHQWVYGAQDSTRLSTCEGQRLVLSKAVDENNVDWCPVGQQHSHPFFKDFSKGTTWADLTSTKAKIGTWTTSCKKNGGTPGAACDSVKGWRLMGAYADSDPGLKDSESSILEYSVTLAKSGRVLFTFTTDGEPGVDYLQFYVDDMTKDLLYQYPAVSVTWVEFSANLSPGPHTLRWAFVKDTSDASGMNMAAISEVVVTGVSSDVACEACPPGHCSDGGISGCEGCGVGTYADSGAPVCSACQNVIPYNAHYSTPESSKSTCDMECDHGYVNNAGSCAPKDGVCFLPANDLFNGGKIVPPTFQMVSNCLKMKPMDIPSAQKTVTTLLNTVPLYAFADTAAGKTFQQNLGLIQTKLNSKQFPSDWDFQRALVAAGRFVNDGNLYYSPPLFYQSLKLFLPISLNMSLSSSGGRAVFVNSLNPYIRMIKNFYVTVPGQSDPNSLIGFQVLKIDDKDALTVLGDFSKTQVGLSDDPDSRLQFSTAGDDMTVAPGVPESEDPSAVHHQWSCSFSLRLLHLCDLPSSEFVKLTLLNVNKTANPSGASVDVILTWTSLYEGINDIDIADGKWTWSDPTISNRWCPNSYFNHERSWLNNLDRYPSYPTPELGEGPGSINHVMAGDVTLTVVDSYPTAAFYLLSTVGKQSTGVIQLTSFDGEELFLHSILSQAMGASPDRLVVDVRGNGGGNMCHAAELAYLLSNQFDKPPPLFVDVRYSMLMNITIASQSGGFVNDTQVNDFSNYLEYQLRPDTFLTDDGEGHADDAWYDQGVNGYSQKVQVNCAAFSSLRSFYLHSLHIHSTKLLSFPPEKLMIVTDNRCSGACAVFVRLMLQNNAATVATHGLSEGGSFPGGITTTLYNMQCQWKADSTWTPSLYSNIVPEPFTLQGQEFGFTIARVYGWGDNANTPLRLTQRDKRIVQIYSSVAMNSINPLVSDLAMYAQADSFLAPPAPAPQPGPNGGGGGVSSGVVAFLCFLFIIIGILFGGAIVWHRKEWVRDTADRIRGMAGNRKMSGYSAQRDDGLGRSRSLPGSLADSKRSWHHSLPCFPGSKIDLEDQYSTLRTPANDSGKIYQSDVSLSEPLGGLKLAEPLGGVKFSESFDNGESYASGDIYQAPTIPKL